MLLVPAAVIALLLADPHAVDQPLHRQAETLIDASRPLEAWQLLADGLAARLAAGGWEDPRARAEIELAARLFGHLCGDLEVWPETLAALAAMQPWPADAPPAVAGYLARLQAVALTGVGRAEEAREVSRGLGVISDWIIIGPFDNERGSGFETRYPPESQVDPGAALPGKEREVRWRSNPAPEQPFGRVDLAEMLRPSEQVVAYLATAIESTGPRDAVLRLGTSCAFKVFLNGVELAARKVERTWRADQDRVVLPLQPGGNQLLLKLAHEEGPWLVEARLTELDGSPAVGLVAHGSGAGSSTPAPRATSSVPAPEFRDLVEPLGDEALAQRQLALWHLLVSPDDRDAQGARRAAERAVALEPEDVGGLYLLARAAFPEGKDPNEADYNPHLHALQDVLAKDPGHVAALLDLADFSLEVNPVPTRADELSARALEAAPESGRALDVRARALRARDADAAAEAVELRALGTREGGLDSSSLVELSREQLAAGRPDEALATLQDAAARRALSTGVVEVLAAWLVDAGRVDEALAATERALQGMPFDVGLMREIGNLVEHGGAPEAARGLYERALRICPEHTAVLSDLVRLDEREGRLDDARERLEEIVRLDPGNEKARRHLDLLSTEEDEQFEDPYHWDALALASRPLPETGGNDPLEMLRRTQVWRVHPDGTEHRYEHVVYRALNAGGVKQLDRQMIWAPADASLRVLEVRMIRPDGSFERAPAPQRSGGGWQGRSFDMPPLREGDLVELEYRIDEKEADVFGEYFGTRHTFYPDDIDPLAPTGESELIVLAPPDVPLYVSERNADRLERSTTTDAGGLQVLRWVARELPRPVLQSAMPDRVEFAPVVDVTTFRDWDAFARWWWSFIEKEFVTTPEMRAKVAELTAGLSTERERVEAINKFVAQEIRYNAWPFGTHGYEPYSAATIFERRFGDCKDKSILLRQMLAEVGVDSVPVLIMARYQQPDEPLDAAMVGMFNHCIAYVTPTDARDGYYLDGTADRNPFGYLRADDQGARVLHVTPEGGELHDIAYAPPEENALRRRYDVQLAPDGSGTVTLQDSSNGAYGVTLRYRYGGEQGDLPDKLARELSGSFGSVTVESASTSELDDILEPAQLQATFRAPSLWTPSGDRRTLRLGFDDLGLAGLAVEPPEERLYDVVLDRPFAHQTTVLYRLPPGASVVRLPPAAAVAAEGLLEYRQEVRQTEEGVEVTRSFVLPQRRIGLDQYATFRQALREVQLAEERAIEVLPAAAGEGGR